MSLWSIRGAAWARGYWRRPWLRYMRRSGSAPGSRTSAPCASMRGMALRWSGGPRCMFARSSSRIWCWCAKNEVPMIIDDPALIDDWHPVARDRDLAEGGVLAARLLGEDLVLWRAGGQAHAWQDLCVHRGAKLSLGRVDGQRLACAYHGWAYGGDGRCVHIPAHPEQSPPAKAVVRGYQVRERYGLLWVCLGTPSGDIPPFPEWDQPGFGGAVCGPFSHI